MSECLTENNGPPGSLGEWVTFCHTFFAASAASLGLSGVLPPFTLAGVSIKRAKVTQLYKPALSIISLCYD